MIKNMRTNTGLSILGFLLIVAVAILVLSYFDVKIQDVVESPTAQENIGYVKGGARSFWDKYLHEPASYIWNDVWVGIFWKGFIYNMERIRDGKSTDFDDVGNKLRFGN